MYKLIVAGARTVSRYSEVTSAVDSIMRELRGVGDIEIVSGNALGVDRYGEQYAQEHSLDLVIMPANWKKNGKSAGFKRNQKMAKYADGLVAIKHKNSKGTKMMIEIAKANELDIWEFEYKG